MGEHDDMLRISPRDLREISAGTAQLGDLRMSQIAVRDRMLEAVLKLIPCEAPCSLLQLDDFYQNDGSLHVRRSTHRNLFGAVGNMMLQQWVAHVKRRESPVERALHAQSLKDNVGSGRLDDLLVRREWERTPEGRLAERFSIGDLAYMWVRCSPQDVWAIALRRYQREPRFNVRDREILAAFGEVLYGTLTTWFLTGLEVLTPTETRVIQDWTTYGDGQKQAAPRLGMKLGTYKKHCEHIYDKIGVHGMAQVEARLRKRFRAGDNRQAS